MIVLDGTLKDLGGFTVRRVLPQAARRAVGPFVFFDHIGPADVPAGDPGIMVRPHPHIGLATVTYLFDGSFVHRDSTGAVQPIKAGDVNWMIAGKGIVHSERQSPDEIRTGQRLHGLQVWCALPQHLEECEPSFEHHGKETLPVFAHDGGEVTVVIGDLFGHTSPVSAPSVTLYAMVSLPAQRSFTLPATHQERAVFVTEGDVTVNGEKVAVGQLAVADDGDEHLVVVAAAASTICLVGGDALDAHRYMEWNFVSSRRERIAQAVDDWRNKRFPVIASDADEFIPY